MSSASSELNSAELPIEPHGENSLNATSGVATLTRIRLSVAIVIWTVACDLLIYRFVGWFSAAILTLLLPLVLLIGKSRLSRGYLWTSFLVAAIMLCAVKMMWHGTPLLMLITPAVLWTYIAMWHNLPNTVPQALFVPVRIAIEPLQKLVEYQQSNLLRNEAESVTGKINSRGWERFLLIFSPVVAIILFGTFFVLANPNLRVIYSDWSTRVQSYIAEVRFSELCFIAFSAFVGLGLLLPMLFRKVDSSDVTSSSVTRYSDLHPLFAPARATLWSVVVLFAAYLLFEFSTMWFREFPVGFYYAGYAHEGAFWLTAALAIATIVLSALFSAPMLADHRIRTLRLPAWIWSGLNFLLALAALNRLAIYVGFNGLTHMRIVGMIGVATVAAGFSLVVYKIAVAKNFGWLVNHQLWAASFALALYAILPVDWIANRYNAHLVKSGKLPPSVQISEQAFGVDGMLPLFALIDHEDSRIRNGVRALLAAHATNRSQVKGEHWSDLQLAESQFASLAEANMSKLQPYVDSPAQRKQALHMMQTYTYQWY